MNPIFTIKHKILSKHQSGFALQLSDSINNCLETIVCNSNRPVTHQTCLTVFIKI